MQKWMLKCAQIDIGLNLMGLGKHDEAIEHFTALIEKHPDDDELYFWRGQVFRDAGKHSQTRHTRSYLERVDYFERVEVVNTPQSTDYFEKSIKDYKKALDILLY